MLTSLYNFFMDFTKSGLYLRSNMVYLGIACTAAKSHVSQQGILMV